jgi:RNA polymerase sigma-70 factor (ECF subfamily)
LQQHGTDLGQDDAELVRSIRSQTPEAALAALLERYGDEIYGFLRGTLADATQAEDAFALFMEAAWQALPNFEARCSLRTYAYTLARHARGRILRDPSSVPGRRAPSAELEQLAARVRTRTASFLVTESKNAIAQLRSALDPEERLLLLLRVDRQLPWNDVARIMLGEADADRSDIERESAKLRKRFEAIKGKLRTQARSLGLLDR